MSPGNELQCDVDSLCLPDFDGTTTATVPLDDSRGLTDARHIPSYL
jgi:hypothetical protein